MFPISKYIKS
uniref:Uncharacterized protein n=1 Tax=Arundo donax TaxID=35708 RepID=A0A0A9B349_ARUDO